MKNSEGGGKCCILQVRVLKNIHRVSCIPEELPSLSYSPSFCDPPSSIQQSVWLDSV